MAQRKAMPLSYGEYVSPETATSTQAWYARQVLVRTVRRVLPGFLNKLAEEVFPFYTQMAREGYSFEKILWNRHSPFQALKPDGGLKSALSNWAAAYHAEAEWLLDAVLRTFRLWSVSPDALAKREWYSAHPFSDRAADVAAFEFTCPGWRTELTTWAAYRDSVRKDFKDKLLEYEKQSREFAESRGLVRAQRQYSSGNFEWFVLYQFAGMSSKQIADHCASRSKPVDDSTVLKGIRAAARLIGWYPLRAGEQARNRKTR